MKAWTLAKKDLLIYCRDKTGLLLGIGLPIVLALIFGTAMGAMNDGGGGASRVRLYVEDRDGSDLSKELIEALQDSATLRISLVDLEQADLDQDDSARGRVATGNSAAGLLIEEGFEESMGGEDPSSRLRLFRDPSKQVEAQVLAGSLMPVFFEVFGDLIGQHMMTDSLRRFGFTDEGIDEVSAFVEGAWERYTTPAEGEESATGGSGFGGFSSVTTVLSAVGLETEDVVGGGDAAEAMRIGTQAHAVAGIAVMMLLFGLVACGSTLREEEEEGTLDRLRLASDHVSILGGKFLFTWLVGLAQLVILFVVGSFVFDIPFFRDPLALTLLSAATSAAATGFGIFFAATCETRKQVEGLSTLIILAMSAAGGSWFPLFVTPEWFQTLGHFTLNAWAMDGFHGLFLYDRGLSGILTELGVLTGIALGTSGLAVWLWKRRLAV